MCVYVYVHVYVIVCMHVCVRERESECVYVCRCVWLCNCVCIYGCVVGSIRLFVYKFLCVGFSITVVDLKFTLCCQTINSLKLNKAILTYGNIAFLFCLLERSFAKLHWWLYCYWFSIIFLQADQNLNLSNQTIQFNNSLHIYELNPTCPIQNAPKSDAFIITNITQTLTSFSGDLLCNPGYYLQGNSQINCDANGNFSTYLYDFFSCSVHVVYCSFYRYLSLVYSK